MEGDEHDFSALLLRVAQGDVHAQDQLCQQYEPKLRIVARVLLGPALRPYLDSMDLVQSVHRSMLIGFRDSKFDISSPEKLVALACTIVRRKIAKKWRRHRRQQRLGAQLPENVSLSQLINNLSSPESSPTDVAQYEDQVEQLCRCMNETEQRMLMMRLDGFSTAEVAEELGLHPVALRVRWSRLRQRLEDSGILSDLI